MKLLVAFLLAVLGCSLSEGRIVTKCELRDQLVRETANLTDSQKVLTGSNFVPNNTWKLYGLFQLGDKVACNGTSPSANICGTSCSDLLNDDVTDDINCLLKIVTNPPDVMKGVWKHSWCADRTDFTSVNFKSSVCLRK
uniref:lysozyme n=1 Tax=Mastacembelus armatus TaxID=205130 RepID=A0A7N8YF82_9TELE